MIARRSGFTLIELLIVMVLVAILAMIGLSRFWTAKDRALLSTIQNDLRTLAVQQELYHSVHLAYAGALTDLGDFQGSPGVEILIAHAEPIGWAATASHPSAGTKVCGYFYGTVPAGSAAPAVEEGVVRCDD